MKLNKSTRYALYASMDLARAWPDQRITVSQVAARHGISETALAKVFQQLVRARIALGSRGVGGGYELERDPRAVTALDVIEAFEPRRESRQCLLEDAPGECAELDTCRLRRLFDEVEDMSRATFASTSLETLVASPIGRSPRPVEG